jgi:hypothetical protein
MALSDKTSDIALAGPRNRHPQLGEEAILDLFIKEIHGIDVDRNRAP